jgi:NIMA (never in mitosis gene a)-related kinase
MKRCIKGESTSDESSWRVEDRIAPKYLEINKIPGVTEKDTLGSKIEALRAYLELKVGDDEFVKAYSMIQEDRDEDYAQVRKYLGEEKSKFITLIVQLIVCEDSYY